MANENIEVYEFAYYSLNSQKKQTFKSNYYNLKENISLLSGYKNLQTFEVIDNDSLILDFCNWENLEQAKFADESIQNSKEFAKLFEPLNEILFFDNAFLLEEIVKYKANSLGLIELNVYEIDINLRETYNLNRAKFYRFVKDKAKGFQKVMTFLSSEDERINIDLMFWDNLQSANQAHKDLNDNEYFKKFKSCVTELKFWKQLVPFNPEKK